MLSMFNAKMVLAISIAAFAATAVGAQEWQPYGNHLYFLKKVGIGKKRAKHQLHVETRNKTYAIYGFNKNRDEDTAGVAGCSKYGTGVYGESIESHGMHGYSEDNIGVFGQSTTNTGMYGRSEDGIGVYGYSIDNRGVFGFSENNYAVYASGDLFASEGYKPGGGSWASSSDIRLKKNIENLDGALDTLLALRGVTFEYKDPEATGELPGERIGFIAQEVEEVIPDWVGERKDGYKAVTIRGFEALAVEALREMKEASEQQSDAQQAEIARLAQENRDLRAANECLEARLAQLEAVVAQLAAEAAD